MPPSCHPKHDTPPCPRCGQVFSCMSQKATECACGDIYLTADEAEWISWQTGGDCVCVPCLLELRQQARATLNLA